MIERRLKKLRLPSLLLAVTLALTAAGCSDDAEPADADSSETPTPTATPTEATPTEAAQTDDAPGLTAAQALSVGQVQVGSDTPIDILGCEDKAVDAGSTLAFLELPAQRQVVVGALFTGEIERVTDQDEFGVAEATETGGTVDNRVVTGYGVVGESFIAFKFDAKDCVFAGGTPSIELGQIQVGADAPVEPVSCSDESFDAQSTNVSIELPDGSTVGVRAVAGKEIESVLYGKDFGAEEADEVRGSFDGTILDGFGVFKAGSDEEYAVTFKYDVTNCRS